MPSFCWVLMYSTTISNIVKMVCDVFVYAFSTGNVFDEKNSEKSVTSVTKHGFWSANRCPASKTSVTLRDFVVSQQDRKVSQTAVCPIGTRVLFRKV